MAEEEKKEEKEEESEEKKEKSGGGSNLILIIIVVLLVLLLAIGGVVAYLMLSGDDEEQVQEQTQEQEKVEKRKPKRATDDLTVGPMYPLDKFTVNLLSENGSRYLVAKIDLEQDSEELTQELDKKVSLIRDIIISILSSKTVEEISTPKGKMKLKEEIKNQINKYLEDGEVKRIYFTNFIVQ